MIEFCGITKRFAGGGGIEDLHLKVQDGEVLALLGPSGCGKTTALRIAAGLQLQDRGQVLLDGQDITAWPPERRKIGMVFQSYALFPHLSVGGNVAYGLRMRGLGRKAAAAKAMSALERVRLSHAFDRRPEHLSGGEQQRVALARALVIEPRVLLLDEPFSNLDAGLRRELRAELAGLRATVRIPMVFVTHDQEEALALADRIALLRAGKLVQLGTAREIYRQPVSAFAASFLGSSLVLKATIASVTEGEVEVTFGSGIRTKVARRGGSEKRPGQEIGLVIRSEAVSVHMTSSNAIPASIAARTWLGGSLELELLAGGVRISARLACPHPAEALETGHSVGLVLNPEALSLVPLESES